MGVSNTLLDCCRNVVYPYYIFSKNRGHNHSRRVKYIILFVQNTILFCSLDHNVSRANETIYVKNTFIKETNANHDCKVVILYNGVPLSPVQL